MRIFLYCLIVFSCDLAFSLTAPLALSFSDSGRANTQKAAEYHLLNPAVISYANKVYASAFYAFQSGKDKGYWGFSMMEKSKLPLAISILRRRGGKEQNWVLSTSAFAMQGFSLGLSLSRYELDSETHWNTHLGILIKPFKSSFSVGFVWDYILPLEEIVKQKRKWSLGLAYDLDQNFHLRADTSYNPETKWAMMAGVQVLISKFLILRFSSRYLWTEDLFTLGGGAGLQSKQMALDYGLSQTEENHLRHTLNIRFHL